MPKKHRNVLGLHTKEEQNYALKVATDIHGQAKKDILGSDGRDALWFARGYLLAINDLARAEGAFDLMHEVERLTDDLEDAYYKVYPETE